MAQAGHAALECVHALAADFSAWRAHGLPGEVRVADPGAWRAVRERAYAGAGVVVSDAGLTQVAPGTETVAAFPPQEEPPDGLRDLPVLP
jgi:peptidyl-tRNA hydrolase